MDSRTAFQPASGPFGVSEASIDEAREALAFTPGLPFTLGLIPARVHGFFDYLLGLGAIAAPWLFGFDRNPTASRAMQAQGATILLYSLLTNYQWGVFRIIRFPTHLLLDLLGGTFLLAAPRLFGLRRSSQVFTLLGLAELAITLLTQRHSGTEQSMG